MKKLLLSAVLMFLLFGVGNASIFFDGSIDEALTVAKEQGKNVIIDFYSLT